MNYQATVMISDVEDGLEAADLLAPLKGVAKVKVATIMPRPEARPQNQMEVVRGSVGKLPQPPEQRSPLPPQKPQ